MFSCVTESFERRFEPMAEVSRGHSSGREIAKGRTRHERIEDYLSGWTEAS
jgi:hypothetical protein